VESPSGDWKFAAVSVGESDSSHFREHLTEQVSDPLRSILSAHSKHPLPEDRRIDQGVTPQNVADARKALDQLPNRVVLYKSDPARHERRQTVVHGREMKALKIRHVSRDVEWEYLTLSILQHFVPVKPALKHEATLRRPISFAHHIMIRPHVTDGHPQVQNGFFFLLWECWFTLKLPDEGGQKIRHAAAPL
jgi:hypothetical protein